MGFLDFLKKKPVASTQPAAAPAQPSSYSVPSNAQFSLPELPSFDAPTHSEVSHDLPPLPSFDDHSQMNAPASFSLPEMPTFDSATSEPAPIAKESSPSKKSKAAFEPAPMQAPAEFVHSEPDVPFPQANSTDASMPTVDARTPYGPVFCDVETYRAILTNMSHAKEEVIQLQSFAENGLKLQQKTQEHYDDFHNSLSNMAKKLLLAEAKLFK